MMPPVRAVDGRRMDPLVGRAVKNVVPRVRRVGLRSGLFADKKLERLIRFPVPEHMRVSPFPFAAKSFVNGSRIGFRDLRMQFRRRVPDGENGAPLLRVVVLDTTIAARRFAGMPVGAAIIRRRLCGEDRDLAVEAGRVVLASQVPPEMLGLGVQAEKQRADEQDVRGS